MRFPLKEHDTLNSDPTEEKLRQRIQAAVREHERLIVVRENAVERAKTGAPGSRHAEQDAACAVGRASRDVDDKLKKLLEYCRRKHGVGVR